MVRLPPLGDNNQRQKKNNKKVELPEVDSFDPKVREEKILQHFSEMRSLGEDISPEGVEKIFRSILSLAKVNQLETEEDYEIELKNRGLYDIDLLQRAIEEGELNIENYNLVIFSKVIQKLEEKKKRSIVKKIPLDSHGIRSQDEFYDLIASGKIDLEKYTDEEIDSFTKKLGGN